MKRTCAAICSALVVLIGAGCAAPDEGAGGSYRVGVLVDQTGVSAFQGVPAGAGIAAYVKMVNDRGGVHGRQIELEVADSQSNPQGAQTSVQQLLANEPVAVVGFTGSGQMAAIPPVAAPAGIPFLMQISTDSQMVPTPEPWLFTTFMPTVMMMRTILSHLEDTLGGLQGKRLALSSANTPFGDGFAKAFEENAASLGYVPAIVDRAALQLTTFAPNAASIVQSRPDAMILLDLPSLTPLIVKDMAAAGFTGPIVGYEQAGDPTVIQAVASQQYFAFRGAQMPEKTGEMATAAQAAGVVDKMTSPAFSYGWAQAAILVEAISRCGEECTGSDLTSTIEGIDDFTPPGNSTHGPVGFSADKHYATSFAQFYTWDPATGGEIAVGEPVAVGAPARASG